MDLLWKQIKDEEWWLCVAPAAKVAILTQHGNFWAISCLGSADKFAAANLDEAKSKAFKFVIPVVEELIYWLKAHKNLLDINNGPST